MAHGIFQMTIVLMALIVLAGCRLDWNIEDEPMFSRCIALEEKPKMECLVEVISNISSISECDKIKDSQIRSECIYKFSNNSTNISICDQVPARRQTQCRINVNTNIAIKTDDFSVCENLGSSDRFSCLTAMAIRAKDIDLCGGVSPAGLNYRCQEMVIQQTAIDLNDTKICDGFEFQGDKYTGAWVPKARCIEQAAFCNMNELLCRSSDCEYTVKQIKSIGNNEGYICDMLQLVVASHVDK